MFSSTAFTQICKRLGRSKELTKFERFAVIGCHLCNKSVCETSTLLDITRSTERGITAMREALLRTATQP